MALRRFHDLLSRWCESTWLSLVFIASGVWLFDSPGLVRFGLYGLGIWLVYDVIVWILGRPAKR